MTNLEFKIDRFEKLPLENPTEIIIRFIITDPDNGNFCFFENSLPISETLNKTQNEICQVFYSTYKTQIQYLSEQLETKKQSIVGKIFLPHE